MLRRSATDTAAGLDEHHAGDGEAWLRMVAGWDRVRDPLLDALFTPFPPVRSGLRLLRRSGVAGTLDLTRLGLLSVRRLGQEEFGSEEARVLLTGNAMHSDVSPDSAGSALFGWLLVMLGQDVGFPVPEGGAGVLATALRRRAESLGVQVRCGVPVTEVEVSAGRARGCGSPTAPRCGPGTGCSPTLRPPTLYGDLVAPRHLPARLLDDVRRFDWDDSTLKVNWALDGPIPWTAADARGAGTVHLGVDDDGLVDVAADLSVGRMPRAPVPAARPDDDRRPHPLPRGHRVGLGVHAPAAPLGRRRGRDRAPGRADGGRRGAGRPGLPLDPAGPPGAVAR